MMHPPNKQVDCTLETHVVPVPERVRSGRFNTSSKEPESSHDRSRRKKPLPGGELPHVGRGGGAVGQVLPQKSFAAPALGGPKGAGPPSGPSGWLHSVHTNSRNLRGHAPPTAEGKLSETAFSKLQLAKNRPPSTSPSSGERVGLGFSFSQRQQRWGPGPSPGPGPGAWLWGEDSAGLGADSRPASRESEARPVSRGAGDSRPGSRGAADGELGEVLGFAVRGSSRSFMGARESLLAALEGGHGAGAKAKKGKGSPALQAAALYRTLHRREEDGLRPVTPSEAELDFARTTPLQQRPPRTHHSPRHTSSRPAPAPPSGPMPVPTGAGGPWETDRRPVTPMLDDGEPLDSHAHGEPPGEHGLPSGDSPGHGAAPDGGVGTAAAGEEEPGEWVGEGGAEGGATEALDLPPEASQMDSLASAGPSVDAAREEGLDGPVPSSGGDRALPEGSRQEAEKDDDSLAAPTSHDPEASIQGQPPAASGQHHVVVPSSPPAQEATQAAGAEAEGGPALQEPEESVWADLGVYVDQPEDSDALLVDAAFGVLPDAILAQSPQELVDGESLSYLMTNFASASHESLSERGAVARSAAGSPTGRPTTVALAHVKGKIAAHGHVVRLGEAENLVPVTAALRSKFIIGNDKDAHGNQWYVQPPPLPLATAPSEPVVAEPSRAEEEEEEAAAAAAAPGPPAKARSKAMPKQRQKNKPGKMPAAKEVAGGQQRSEVIRKALALARLYASEQMLYQGVLDRHTLEMHQRQLLDILDPFGPESSKAGPAPPTLTTGHLRTTWGGPSSASLPTNKSTASLKDETQTPYPGLAPAVTPAPEADASERPQSPNSVRPSSRASERPASPPACATVLPEDSLPSPSAPAGPAHHASDPGLGALLSPSTIYQKPPLHGDARHSEPGAGSSSERPVARRAHMPPSMSSHSSIIHRNAPAVVSAPSSRAATPAADDEPQEPETRAQRARRRRRERALQKKRGEHGPHQQPMAAQQSMPTHGSTKIEAWSTSKSRSSSSRSNQFYWQEGVGPEAGPAEPASGVRPNLKVFSISGHQSRGAMSEMR